MGTPQVWFELDRVLDGAFRFEQAGGLHVPGHPAVAHVIDDASAIAEQRWDPVGIESERSLVHCQRLLVGLRVSFIAQKRSAQNGKGPASGTAGSGLRIQAAMICAVSVRANSLTRASCAAGS